MLTILLPLTYALEKAVVGDMVGYLKWKGRETGKEEMGHISI